MPGGRVSAWVIVWLWVPINALLAFVALLFPDGKLPSPRWRPVGWLNGVMAVAGSLAAAFLPGPSPWIADIDNPFGVEGLEGVRNLVDASLRGLSYGVFALAGVTSLYFRFRRAGRMEREQIKWLAYAGAVLLAGAILLYAGPDSPNVSWIGQVGFALWVIGCVGLPVAMGIAIFKYRLYEIDVIINRTLVYGALTLVLAGIFQTIDASLHYLLVTLAHVHTLPGSIIAALVVGALFHPVRHLIQRFVDRHLPNGGSGSAGHLEEHAPDTPARVPERGQADPGGPAGKSTDTDRAKAMEGEAVDHQDAFTTETAGLPEASSPSVVRLYDGGSLDLHIRPVRKRIGDAEVRMLGYGGSIPGPTLHVDQGSEITVRATNDCDVETTVHWHGLRLENRYDGVPVETQAPILPGGTFAYELRFPDAGLYWYHPHIREDFAQEMGLYAPIVVEPSDPSYWPYADRWTTITLDDVLIEDGRVAPFGRSGPTFVAMGRFGNVMLTNGETEFSGKAAVGEVVRLYLVNAANTRIFNLALRGARMKLVGGDSGRYEREAFVEEVLLSPSERAIVDVLFDEPGEVRIEHRTPDQAYDLGAFSVSSTVAGDGVGNAAESFEALRTDPELSAERRTIAHYLEREPDKVLSIVASMPLLYGGETEPASSYACPMHPEVTSASPGTCPKCGMKLIPSDALPATASGPREGHAHGGHDHGDGLEWEDLMPEINRATDSSNMIWKIIDREMGAENHEISWSFTVGDRVKIRLVNEMESDHPMHHPFHIHGAGRFLVLSRDGRPEPNLAWKDTVLLRAGETVDILLYATNPGLWMAHCHIAEHIEGGMMFSFNVAASPEGEGH